MNNRILLYIFFCFAFIGVVPASATEIQDVIAANGVHAWLVEDHKLPLISVSIAMRGGTELDPVDKQGLTTLTMDALTEGAGHYNAEAFQRQLADASIQLHAAGGRDMVTVHMKTLTTERAKAFELLRLALTQPRFDAEDVDRLKATQVSAIKSQLSDPNWQGRYALLQKIFGAHPYALRRLGTAQTVSRIKTEDMRDLLARHLALDNLIIAVAGDISSADLKKSLETLFAGIAPHARLDVVRDVEWPSDTAQIQLSRDGTQTNLIFAMPGPKRDDPDWYAAEIANYTLGGGGFSSRLMQDVRDARGLTYGISTSLSPSERAGLIIGQAAVNNPKAGEAWAVTLETMRKFYHDGPADKEINAAKDYLTGALPISLTSTDRISAALIEMQFHRLGKDYLDRYAQLIRQVKADDVRRVIERWFNPEGLTLVMVGKPEGLQASSVRDPVRD